MLFNNSVNEVEEYKKKIIELFDDSDGLIKRITEESLNDHFIDELYKEVYSYMYC